MTEIKLDSKANTEQQYISQSILIRQSYEYEFMKDMNQVLHIVLKDNFTLIMRI